jgi:hypothetical protein
MTPALQRRLAKLEGRYGAPLGGPRLVVICPAPSGEPAAALLLGGGGLMREPGETAETFTARAEAAAGGAG